MRFPLARIWAAALLATAPASPSLAVLESPQTSCSIGKMKGAAAGLGCYLNGFVKLAIGGEVDLLHCERKISSRFEHLEARGGCATEGDSGIAAARAEDTAASILDAFAASLVSDHPAAACLRKKARLATKYARCQSSALASRVRGLFLESGEDFHRCMQVLETRSADLDASGDCTSAGEAPEVEDLAPGGFAFLPGAVWLSSTLNFAPLSHAYLVGSRFETLGITGASFHGADLSGSFFFQIPGSGTPPDFRDAVFEGAQLVGVDLGGAPLGGAQFATAYLDALRADSLPECPASLPPDWVCLAGALLGPKAALIDLDLSGVDLTGVNLSAASLVRVDFTSAILNGVNFAGAVIELSILDDAALSGTDLDGASLYRSTQHLPVATCPDSLPVGFGCANGYIVGPGVRLFDANLSSADLSGLTMDYAYFGSCDFTGANFENASLGSTWWYETICPDGAGSVGSSCCDHLVGAAPAYCTGS